MQKYNILFFKYLREYLATRLDINNNKLLWFIMYTRNGRRLSSPLQNQNNSNNQAMNQQQRARPQRRMHPLQSIILRLHRLEQEVMQLKNSSNSVVREDNNNLEMKLVKDMLSTLTREIIDSKKEMSEIKNLIIENRVNLSIHEHTEEDEED